MNSTLRLVGVLLLVVLALSGLSTLTVSAQGPTGTATPTLVPPSAQTPAAAPPAAAGVIVDDPGRAATLGNAIAAVPTGTGTWFQFNYDTLGNTFPRPPVTIRLLNGVTNGLGFEVWSPERMQGNWFDNKPVGRGTAESLPNTNCLADSGVLVDLSKNKDIFGNDIEPGAVIARCHTNDLLWTGAFGAPGTYFVRIINKGTNNNIAPQLIITGPGIAECQTGALPNVAARLQGLDTQGQQGQTAQGTQGTQVTPGQGFSIVQCQNPTQAQLLALNQSLVGVTQAGPVPAAAPTLAPLATATPLAPLATATTAVLPTVAATATTAAPATAAAPPVSGLPICTPTPTPLPGTTPTAAPTLAPGTTPSPTATPDCIVRP